MPDDLDYAWLGWLVEHPGEWTAADLAVAEALVASQTRAVEERHPKDNRGRESAQEVVDALESAVRTYRRLHSLSDER